MPYKRQDKNKKVLFQFWLKQEEADLPVRLKIKALKEGKTRDELMAEILAEETKGISLK